MELLNSIKEKARELNRRIVLPEGAEERTLRAADKILDEGIARITLLGNPSEIGKSAKSLNLKNIDKATILDPLTHANKGLYAELLYKLRKHKELSREEAFKLVEDPLYLATLLIKNGDADGEVAGAVNATGDVLRPAFQVVKTLPGVNIVSGAFIMIMRDETYGENGVFMFADCAVNPAPVADELAEIAVSTARSTKAILGFEPRIAMLSFSTKGSAKHLLCDKVAEATRIVKENHPELIVDGELQADTAIVEKVAKSKAPGSVITGNANILIFPDLDAGNIAYKLVQRLARAQAVGPVLQGMAAPVNDLSRGCSVEDIVNLVAITANQTAQNNK